MKVSFRLILTLFAMMFLCCCIAPKRFEPGYIPKTLPDADTYDPDTVDVVTGKVIKTTGFAIEEGLNIITLIIETGNNKRYVTYLGPAWYLTLRNVYYENDDMLTIEGSVFSFIEDEEEEEEEIEEDDLAYYLLLARKITKDDRTLFLRTKSGKPRWYRKGMMLGIERNIGRHRGLRNIIFQRNSQYTLKAFE